MTEEKILFQLMDLLKTDNVEDRHSPLAGLTHAEWKNLVNMAAQQAVLSLLYHQLKTKDLLHLVPADVRETLKMNFRGIVFNNMRNFNTLLDIARAFKSSGVPMIVLKGAHLAKTIYPNIALRQMGDLDLLVRKENLPEAASIIIELGYQPETPFSLEWELLHKELPHFLRDDSSNVDLHWNITDYLGLRVDVSDLWENARPFPLEDLNLLCLSPEDLLVHLCIHISYGHQFDFSLRPYCDIQRVINRFSSSLDWARVVANTRRWGGKKGVYLTLRFAHETLDAEVPYEVLEQLGYVEKSDSILSHIRLQILSAYTRPSRIPPDLARLSSTSLRRRIDIMYKTLFPSRIEMAYLYNVPPDSLNVYFRYPLRWLFLFRKYRVLVSELIGGNKDLTAVAERKAMIIEWLAEDMEY